MKQTRCPDCDRPLAEEDQSCSACQPTDVKQEEASGKESKKSSPKPNRRLFLTIGAVLLLSALAVAGWFIFRNSPGSPVDNPPADNGQIVQSEAGSSDENRASDTTQEEPKSILDEYGLCLPKDKALHRITGFWNLQVCVRELDSGTNLLLEVYQDADPAETVSFKAPDKWCSAELGNNFSAIRGQEFTIFVVRHLDSQAGADTSQDSLGPEYVRDINEASKSERDALRSAGWTASLINACSEFAG